VIEVVMDATAPADYGWQGAARRAGSRGLTAVKAWSHPAAAQCRLDVRGPHTTGLDMSYKTILVHCNDKRRIKQLLAPAVHLADTFQAHLLGLSVVPPVSVIATGMPGAPPMIVDAHCQLYREESPDMRSAFEAAARERGFVAEWRDDDAGAFGVADCVLPYARAADLVIASQADPEWAGSAWLDIPDRLAVESGRPVLIVPNDPPRERTGDTVLVAWNGRREAARAVFDAVPILQRAKSVKVVWINPQAEGEAAQDVPAADVCTALARHAVKCEATEQVRPKQGVGETLLGLAKDTGADLLVMGCYGHTRFREFVFGGATRHVLANMPIPVLMSH
jgi:nucleotide-binding universal stress UspA family protein